MVSGAGIFQRDFREAEKSRDGFDASAPSATAPRNLPDYRRIGSS
jgi:hypothetical protein